jgi:hypothetical protein
MGSIDGTEKLIIRDFLDFVNDNFPYLNPYDNLSLCNDYEELVRKRVKNILTAIAIDEEHVEYHTGWANCIKTDWPDIKKVGLSIDLEKKSFSGLTLNLYFGDTAKQAKYFYNRKIDFKTISALLDKKWLCQPNFHLSFMSTGLIWFETPEHNVEKFFNFWQNQIDKIRQYQKEELKKFLAELQELGLIIADNEINNNLENKIYNTKREPINICPGFGLFYKYTANEAIDLDLKNNLTEDIKERFKEGLSITNQTINFIK